MSKYTVKLSQYGAGISIEGLEFETALNLAGIIVEKSLNRVQVTLEREWRSDGGNNGRGGADKTEVSLQCLLTGEADKPLSTSGV